MDNIEYLKSLPKKRMGSGAYFLNEKGELLIVRPNYKDHWTIPGGVVDDGESPRQACIREVKEEIGLDITPPQFLCLDYKNYPEDNDESLQFVFFGGTLLVDQINQIKLDKKELSEYRFVSIDEAKTMLGRGSQQRLVCLEVLKTSQPLYLENGQYENTIKLESARKSRF